MKKFLKKFSFYLFIILSICFISQYLIDAGLRKYDNNLYGNLNRMYHGEINADIIFGGTSRIRVTIDPKIIEDSTKLSSYNFGLDGSGFDSEMAIWEFYLNHNKPPKLLVQDVDFLVLVKEKYLYRKEQYLPYLDQSCIYNKLKNIDNNLWYEKYIPLYKYRGLREQIFLGIKSFFNIAKKPEYSGYKGYEGQDIPWDNKFDEFREQYKVYIFREHELDRGFNYLKNLIKECKEKNIQLILINPPMYIGFLNLYVQRDSIDSIVNNMAKANNIQYWNYSSDSLNYKRKYFYNSMHLNMTGSKIFSRDVAEKLKRYISTRKKIFHTP